MKTFELARDEFAEAVAAKGHAEMWRMGGSGGRTWECGRCRALVYRESGVLSGWALTYTCNEVYAVNYPDTDEP